MAPKGCGWLERSNNPFSQSLVRGQDRQQSASLHILGSEAPTSPQMHSRLADPLLILMSRADWLSAPFCPARVRQPDRRLPGKLSALPGVGRRDVNLGAGHRLSLQGSLEGVGAARRAPARRISRRFTGIIQMEKRRRQWSASAPPVRSLQPMA